MTAFVEVLEEDECVEDVAREAGVVEVEGCDVMR